MLNFKSLLNKFRHQSVTYATVDEWYQSLAGQRLLDDVGSASKDQLSQCFGYYAVQLGCPSLAPVLLKKSRVRHQYILGETQLADISAQFEQLPLASDSVDLVIAPHSFSCSKWPHCVLREIDRVLVPEGKLVIVEMNPFSFWGLRHYLQGWLETVPWAGKIYSRQRLTDWLTILGFKKIDMLRVHYDMPLSSDAVYSMTNWLSKALKRWLPFSSAVNVLIYEKSITPLTPIKPFWQQRLLNGSRLPTPYGGTHNKQ